MINLSIKKFSLAAGITVAALYLGCALFMIVAGREGTIWLFNSLLHGLDLSEVARMKVPILDGVIGLVLTFVLGYITGALFAWIYNRLLRNE